MLTEMVIKQLEEKGFKRWTKGNFDRLYINTKELGLECEYYNTGNIRYAHLNGEKVSNTQARKMKDAKTYIDIKTGKLYGSHDELKELAEAIYAEVMV